MVTSHRGLNEFISASLIILGWHIPYIILKPMTIRDLQRGGAGVVILIIVIILIIAGALYYSNQSDDATVDTTDEVVDDAGAAAADAVDGSDSMEEGSVEGDSAE